jgi:hypothetical protein
MLGLRNQRVVKPDGSSEGVLRYRRYVRLPFIYAS